jgi:hypothetical protein
MLRNIFSKKAEVWMLIVHAVLAIAVASSNLYIIIPFYIFLFVVLLDILYSKATRSFTILLALGYIFSMEVFFRMLKTSPLIPYEAGKYLFLFLLVVGLAFRPSKWTNRPAIWMVLLLLPGLFFIPIDGFRLFFVNSYLGIVLVALSALFFTGERFSEEQISSFFRAVIYPALFGVAFLTFSGPDLREVEYELSANSSTTGGFGSNQVSTIFGAAILLILLKFLRREGIFSFLKGFDLVLLGLLGFRALLTFSRGGILGALVVALVALFWPGTRDKTFNMGTQWRVILFAALGLGVFSVVDQITGGNLTLRYQGETAGTAGGYREKDLNVITSRRSSLVSTEFEIFANNPIFGVGPGAGYAEREKYEGVRIASHTEPTRLMAEQGVFGLAVALIFLIYPLLRIRRLKIPVSKYYSIAFFGIAVLTSLHSAMRTTITPLFWGLGCAMVLPHAHPGLRR